MMTLTRTTKMQAHCARCVQMPAPSTRRDEGSGNGSGHRSTRYQDCQCRQGARLSERTDASVSVPFRVACLTQIFNVLGVGQHLHFGWGHMPQVASEEVIGRTTSFVKGMTSRRAPSHHPRVKGIIPVASQRETNNKKTILRAITT